MKFGDTVTIGDRKGVIIYVQKKRKWTYYFVVFEDWETVENDWDRAGAEYYYIREDKLNGESTR